MATAPSPRRIGAEDSKTRAQLLDAAEHLLVEDGYAAVTSRKVAARAGLKPQLVHYYFRTMDDLFLEVFRRRADENLERFEREVAAAPSLAALWRFGIDPRGSVFTIELAALANHRKAIRAELARYAERYRTAQLQVLDDVLAAGQIGAVGIPATALLLLLTGVGQVMGIERALGVTTGHEDTVAFIEQAILQLDAPR
jgi:AcrR family transcriptional regulator